MGFATIDLGSHRPAPPRDVIPILIQRARLARVMQSIVRMPSLAECAPVRDEPTPSFGQPRWYALYTKPFREGFAATKVRERGLEVLFPCFSPGTSARRASPPRSRPLFPGYIFARFQPARDLQAVRNTPGVTHVLGSGHRPAPVPDAIIDELKARRPDDGPLGASGALRTGDRVGIDAGPLRGLIASFERECDDGMRVMLLLNALGHVRICIDKDCLQPMV